MTDRQVKVSLVIDDHGSVKVMRQAGDESGRTESKLEHLDKGVKKLGGSFGGLKSLIGAGIGAIGLGGLAFGIKDVVSGMETMATETEKFHAVTGIGAQQSLDYTAALKARGIGAEAGANAFKFLSKNIQTAERQMHSYGVAQLTAAEKGKVMTGLLGVQAGAFKELGINVTEFAKLSEQGKFERVTKAFEGMTDGAQKTRLAVQIFGRGGTALLPVLDKGALGLSHFTDMAKKFFPTLKGGEQGLEEWKVKQGEFKLATEGLEFTLGMKLIPVLTGVSAWFSKTILEIEKGHGTWGTLGHDVEGIVKVGKEVVSFFEHSTVGAEGLHVALGLVGGVWAVEKVAGFVRAIKGLAILQGINKLLGVGGLATTAAEAGDGAAIGMAAMLPELAAVTLAVAGIYEAAKHAEEIRGFFGLGGTTHTWKGPKSSLPGGQKWTRRALETAVHEDRSPHATKFQQEGRLELEHILASMPPIKVDVHMDSHKVATAIARHPAAARVQAESTAHYTSKMAARR